MALPYSKLCHGLNQVLSIHPGNLNGTVGSFRVIHIAREVCSVRISPHRIFYPSEIALLWTFYDSPNGVIRLTSLANILRVKSILRPLNRRYKCKVYETGRLIRHFAISSPLGAHGREKLRG